jgi:hypothetical protein
LVFVVKAIFAVVSHASSAASSVSFPLTRLMWHLKIVPTSFPVALADAVRAFGQGTLPGAGRYLAGVIPPNGVPAVVQ